MSSRASALLLALALGTAAAASAQEAGPIVIIDRPATGDLYLAGDEVVVRAPVEGDVVAAGRSVTLEARVTEDATLAGEHVVIEAEVGDDVRAAGRRVHLAAPVAGHVALAGETVLVDRAARVGDFAWLAGQDVVLRGAVGSLHARGETVTIAGEVDGDADVAATSIRLAPGAIVRGDLRWSAEQPPVVDGAQVGGRLVEVERARVPTAGDRVLGVLFWVVSLIIASVLLFLALPRFSAQVARTARTSPWRSVGAGLAILAGVPLVVALSFPHGRPLDRGRRVARGLPARALRRRDPRRARDRRSGARRRPPQRGAPLATRAGRRRGAVRADRRAPRAGAGDRPDRRPRAHHRGHRLDARFALDDAPPDGGRGGARGAAPRVSRRPAAHQRTT
ncbi:MAG: hypothetical protein M5U28_11060 [Sandaracinaceae bacterium]|nr:hypothetical protein [Sandaracinaceae bacterium]